MAYLEPFPTSTMEVFSRKQLTALGFWKKPNFTVTVFPLLSASDAYLILKLQDAALIVRQRLKEEAAYFKVR